MSSRILVVLAVIIPVCFKCSLSSCVHDKISVHLPDITKANVTYKDKEKSHDTREDSSSLIKRSVSYSSDIFSSLRFHLHFHDLQTELSVEDEASLQSIVQEVIDKMSSILSVRPVDGPLLLARSKGACKQAFASGPNKDRCATIASSYRGETCLDGFRIPDEHVEGLYLWNSTHPDPVMTVYEEGAGIPDTDYILYIQAISTAACVTGGSNVIAYAMYCQLDQFSRPIAGYINFCPQLLRDNRDNPDKLKTVAFHELFHALGFSASLFHHFQDCRIKDGSLSCRTRRNVIETVLSTPRLITPKVAETASRHFNCQFFSTGQQFGPTLQSDGDTVMSHWDAAFMFSSIMTPTIGEPMATILDNMTLSALEDSGWYNVDYSQAQPFLWGKDGGCHFGLYPHCTESDSRYFCNTRAVGCHHLLRYKAPCKTDIYLHGCQVHKANHKDSCLLSDEGATELSTGEVKAYNSRCFLSNLTQNGNISREVMMGHCFRHKCDEEGQLLVKVGQTNWTICPWDSSIEVAGYVGVLQCPIQGILCVSQPPSTAATSTLLPTSTDAITQAIETSITIELMFDTVTLSELVAAQLDQIFITNIVDLLCQLTGISHRRVNNPHLAEGSTLFICDLHPGSSTVDAVSGPASPEVGKLLRQAVEAGNFTVHLKDSLYHTATSYRHVTGSEMEPSGETVSGTNTSKAAQMTGVLAPITVVTLISNYLLLTSSTIVR